MYQLIDSKPIIYVHFIRTIYHHILKVPELSILKVKLRTINLTLSLKSRPQSFTFGSEFRYFGVWTCSSIDCIWNPIPSYRSISSYTSWYSLYSGRSIWKYLYLVFMVILASTGTVLLMSRSIKANDSASFRLRSVDVKPIKCIWPLFSWAAKLRYSSNSACDRLKLRYTVKSFLIASFLCLLAPYTMVLRASANAPSESTVY